MNEYPLSGMGSRDEGHYCCLSGEGGHLLMVESIHSWFGAWAWYSLRGMEWDAEEAVGVGREDRKSSQGRWCLKFLWQMGRVSKGGKWHGSEKAFPAEALGRDGVELVQNQRELVWLEWKHGRSGRGWGWRYRQGWGLTIVLEGLETVERFQGRERRHQVYPLKDACSGWIVGALKRGRGDSRPIGRLLMSHCHHNNCKHLKHLLCTKRYPKAWKSISWFNPQSNPMR